MKDRAWLCAVAHLWDRARCERTGRRCISHRHGDHTSGLTYLLAVVERVAPGYCTSEPGFTVFLDRFKERFDRSGVGSLISLP